MRRFAGQGGLDFSGGLRRGGISFAVVARGRAWTIINLGSGRLQFLCAGGLADGLPDP